MRFNSIRLKEANDERLISFSATNNLIHSSNNSKGKTTLLRMLLYSLGFNIPNTKNIKFENCEVEVNITLDSGEAIELVRNVREYLILRQGDNNTTYILPSQQHDLHKIIFRMDNNDLLNNILGVFYFDQEKGWTLLNRGVVIGSNRFNIGDLIRGINGIDCSELIQLREQKKQELSKYRQMYSVSKYQETIDVAAQNIATESYNVILESRIEQCKMQKSLLLFVQKILKRINSSMTKEYR